MKSKSADTTCASECMCDVYRPKLGAESNGVGPSWVAATCKLMCGNKKNTRTRITKKKQSNANIYGAQEAKNVEGDFYFYLLKSVCTIFHHRTSISNAARFQMKSQRVAAQHPHPRSSLSNAKDDEATNKSLHTTHPSSSLPRPLKVKCCL